MAAENIPNYRLYGEQGDQAEVEFVHCETISRRSVVHNWNIQPHRHDTLYQLFCLEAGGGSMLLEGATLPLPVPGVLVVPPMVVHGFRFQNDTKGIVVTINERGMDRILASAPGLLSHLSVPKLVRAGGDLARFGELRALFHSVQEEFDGDRPGRLCALQSHLGLVFVWLTRSLASATDRHLSVVDKQVEMMRDFRALVESRFRDHLPVSRYAAALGITPTHLNRISRNVLGKSALMVIHDRLLLEAKRYLVYTSMSVKEISHLLGFSDPGYFARFFSRSAGTSPSEFRNASREASRRSAARAVEAAQPTNMLN